MFASHIVALLRQAQRLALKEYGVTNILQPGIVKELIMAEILGHSLVPEKHLSDAKDTEGNYYEYLASIRRIGVKNNNGCSFQVDRVTRNNLTRVTRNEAFYFGVFKNHLEIEEIWRASIPVVLDEVRRQLDNCKNEIAHVNFLLKWVTDNCTRIYPRGI